jgi:hypothetical protein
MICKSFLATTGNGLARASHSENGTWQVEQLLPGQDVRCLAVDPLNRSIVYAGTQGNGVLRSDDGGRTWRQAGMEGQIVKSLAASPTEPGVVYAGTKPAFVFVSRDGGASWQELEGFRRVKRPFWFSPAEKPYIAYAHAIALSPTDPNKIVVGIEAGATVCSRDGGKTWQGHRRGSLRDCHTLTFHATQEWVYEGGGSDGGAAYSRDGGQTWKQHKVGLDRHYGWAVAADPAQPELWYVSVSPGPYKAHVPGKAEAYIFRSEGGAPWEKLSGGLPQPLDNMPYALLTDPNAPGHLYAGLINGDVWHSTNHGDSWERMSLNLGALRGSLVML